MSKQQNENSPVAVAVACAAAVAAYKAAITAERRYAALTGAGRLDGGFTVRAGDESPTAAAWQRLAALLSDGGGGCAPWGAHGAYFVTRSSGWPCGNRTATLWANRRVVAAVDEDGDLRVRPHGKAAVRAHRARTAAAKAAAAAEAAMFQPLLERLDEALLRAPLGALRYAVETGAVPYALDAAMPHGVALRGGQKGGCVVLTLSDGRRARFGAARRIKRALAEARVDSGAERCATLPAVWRRGFDADLR